MRGKSRSRIDRGPGLRDHHRQRRLTALFVILALAGCAPNGGGTETGAEPVLSAKRASRHQRYALTREPDSQPWR
jgi:hypothetical protein